jgi:hypothetical protein
MQNDVAPVVSRVRLEIAKFEDTPDVECKHWRAPVTGRHCGHYIESVTKEGVLGEDGSIVVDE